MQKSVNLVDLVKSYPYSNEYLLAKIGVDTAENEPLKDGLVFKLWDLIFTEPPRPGCAELLVELRRLLMMFKADIEQRPCTPENKARGEYTHPLVQPFLSLGFGEACSANPG